MNPIEQDRCNARWKLLGDTAGGWHKRGVQMEAYVHVRALIKLIMLIMLIK